MTTSTTAPAVAVSAQPPAARPRRRSPWFKSREELTAFGLLAPALAAFLLFMLIPMILTFALSFFRWSGISFSSLEFIGLENYQKLFADDVFWLSLKNNMIFIVLGTAAVVVLGLFVAVMLEQGFPGSNFFRGVFFLPTVLSLVVIGIVFGFLLSPQFGLLGPILSWFGVEASPDLLGNPVTALYTLIGIETWRSFGFAMFLFVAGLKAVDPHLTEAARIDGASSWQVFWHVTLPQLRPVTLMVSTLIGIGMLKLFDIIYVMTLGGPQHATEVLNTYSYFEAFSFNNVGYGATVAVVLLVITFGLTIVRFKVIPDERREKARTQA